MGKANGREEDRSMRYMVRVGVERLRRAGAAARHEVAAPGQALALFAVMAFALIACVGMVTDTGQLWITRRHLQNSADAAALAGAQNLPDDPDGARTVACDYATAKNSVRDMTVDCNGADIEITASNTKIKVKTHRTVTPMVGALFGWSDINIHASATAVVGSVAAACPFPLFQTPGNLADVLDASGNLKDPPVLTKLKAGPSGEFLALEVDGSSSKPVWEAAVSSPQGCGTLSYSVKDGLLDPNPGNFVGPMTTAMTNREDLWKSQGNCTSYNPADYLRADGTFWNGNIQLTPTTCYRMVKIPLINANLSSIGPSDKFPPTGFAVFYIAAWCGVNPCAATSTFPYAMGKGEIWGYYIPMEVGGGSDYIGYDGYGTKVIALAD